MGRRMNRGGDEDGGGEAPWGELTLPPRWRSPPPDSCLPLSPSSPVEISLLLPPRSRFLPSRDLLPPSFLPQILAFLSLLGSVFVLVFVCIFITICISYPVDISSLLPPPRFFPSSPSLADVTIIHTLLITYPERDICICVFLSLCFYLYLYFFPSFPSSAVSIIHTLLITYINLAQGRDIPPWVVRNNVSRCVSWNFFIGQWTQCFGNHLIALQH